MVTKAAEAKSPSIYVPPISAVTMVVPIIGTMPLIVRRFSEKAKQQMLDLQQAKKSPKTNKDPEAEYQEGFYYLDDGTYGFPTLAFKAATISAARYFDKSVSMVLLRQCVSLTGETNKHGEVLNRLVNTSAPRMREDFVRYSQTSTDLRYRPQFDEWGVDLTVTYVESMLSQSSVLALIDAGGLGVGVGEWRPQKGGQFGTYRIDPNQEVKLVE